MEYTSQELREAWVNACLSEVGTRSVGDEDRITEYFRGINWGWAIDRHCPDGVYDDEVRKKIGRSGPLNWCGIGPAYCGVHLVGQFLEDGQCVPVRLLPDIANYVLPSTYRNQSKEIHRSHGLDKATAITLEDIQRGDLATVKTGAGIRWGDHIVVVTGKSGANVETVEFNAYGDLGNGFNGRGVVRRIRALADVVQVRRFDERHFEGAA